MLKPGNSWRWRCLQIQTRCRRSSHHKLQLTRRFEALNLCFQSNFNSICLFLLSCSSLFGLRMIVYFSVSGFWSFWSKEPVLIRWGTRQAERRRRREFQISNHRVPKSSVVGGTERAPLSAPRRVARNCVALIAAPVEFLQERAATNGSSSNPLLPPFPLSRIKNACRTHDDMTDRRRQVYECELVSNCIHGVPFDF